MQKRLYRHHSAPHEEQRMAQQGNYHITDMSHSQMLGKVESSGGPIFKVVLEC